MGKYGDHQTAALTAFVVEGAQLAPHRYCVALLNRGDLQLRCRDDHRQLVRKPTEPLYRQREFVEGYPVVDVAQLRDAVHRAAQLHAVEVVVHMMSTSFVDMPQPMCRRRKICFSNGGMYGIITAKE